MNENTLGGKVVWMRPDGADYTLYYAHLDSQLVSDGQRVKTGDVLGLIGNTGNARTTPAHLHFGIYASGGAIDPWPFINVNPARSQAITADSSLVNKPVRAGNQHIRYNGGTLEKPETGSSLRVLAATGDQLRIRLPDGREGFVNSKSVSTGAIRQAKLRQSAFLLAEPTADAAVREELASGTPVAVLSSWKGFHFIHNAGKEGWVSSKAL